MKLSIGIYVNLLHMCRESEFGSNSLVYTWRSGKLHLHHWAVEIMSAHRLWSERWATCLHGGEAVILAVVDMSRNWYSVYCHEAYATLQKTLHNITVTWSRQQWNGFSEMIAFEDQNNWACDLSVLPLSQSFSSSFSPHGQQRWKRR